MPGHGIDTRRVRKDRILVEDEDAGWQKFLRGLGDFVDSDFEYCPGPMLVAGGCPLVRGEPCEKVDRADSILNSLDQQEEANVALLQALGRRNREFTMTRLESRPTTHCFTRKSGGRAIGRTPRDLRPYAVDSRAGNDGRRR